MIPLWLIYWLLAGFISFSIIGNFFKNKGIMAYDDSLWILIFGGWFSLIAVIVMVTIGKNL